MTPDGDVEKSDVFFPNGDGEFPDQKTHGSLWGHEYTNRCYKGRYEIDTGKLSIVPPYLGHFPIDGEEALEKIREAFPDRKKEIIFK